MYKPGCPYGTHRVLEPKGVLPQPAWKIDNTMEIYDNELLIDVDTLNIDAASFTQIKKQAQGDAEAFAAIMRDIVSQRGKHHNPVTGSGGMLMGTVQEIGPKFAGKTPVKVGDRIATLVSLSLTPLQIHRIKAIDMEKDQASVEAQAILFSSGIYAVLPEDMSPTLALAILDVAGAPAQTAHLVRPGQTVLIIGGGGKSGLLCAYEAKKRAGITGKIIGLGSGKASCARMERLGVFDHILQVDATDPLKVLAAIQEATQGNLADVTINCVNIPGTEMSSILATKENGLVYFFSMATSFTAAALGAEGIGKDVTMLIGNGYCKDHAVVSLQTVRECPVLMEIFQELFA
ncbi:L-erythro-3,5-diaminohexanoate dehydrogenase [Candidatus Formimonas warabiya]|uniref:L-erythro-3,5-diaminohexanoate dehydrogenase n=1 Tax=Formimonas warabiya TaxID=1761012 RepID=A0A3G1KWU9_FORW1|nr:L-erythro-3,5-diaminohexanoate dehydrogenase [Candidatus Formimonas warabiya]ATW26911.1 L-erythro-3,5-diaminohexanoate dehydrogenase [Candidatus Formimonas warabiya]